MKELTLKLTDQQVQALEESAKGYGVPMENYILYALTGFGDFLTKPIEEIKL